MVITPLRDTTRRHKALAVEKQRLKIPAIEMNHQRYATGVQRMAGGKYLQEVFLPNMIVYFLRLFKKCFSWFILVFVTN